MLSTRFGALSLYDVEAGCPDLERMTFEEIYVAHAPRVYRFCLSLLRDPTRAEDVANDVFVHALAAFDRSPPDAERVVVWLFSIARHAAIDDIRKRSRWQRLFQRIGPDSVARSGDDPNAAIDARAELRRVLDAMKTLKPRDRTLIALRIGAELSDAEMATIMAMDEHAVSMATRRALERLRAALGGRQ